MADQSAAIKAAMQLLMKQNAEKPNSGERPPNLRQGDEHENCGNCEHFDEGRCTLYSYKVTPEQVCDSWAPIPESGK